MQLRLNNILTVRASRLMNVQGWPALKMTRSRTTAVRASEGHGRKRNLVKFFSVVNVNRHSCYWSASEN